MKTLEIGGEVFEVIRSSKTEDMIYYHGCDRRGRKTLYDFYDKPSTEKRTVWKDWEEWQAQNYPMVYNMLVISASQWTFTIGAFYRDPETREILGYFRITKDHNRLYLLK